MKFVVFCVVGVAVLGGLFIAFKPGPSVVPAEPRALPSSPPERQSPPAVPVVEPGDQKSERADAGSTVELVVAQGKLTSGPSVVRVKQNDTVVFHVTSDVADELHLHGYNLHLPLKPGRMATLEVRTTRAGRFTYELHRLDREIGALEVYPR